MNRFRLSARRRAWTTAVREVAADPTARFIAGGTNLIDLMKDNVERPDRLIDITRLPLNGIEETDGGGLRIGALVTNDERRLRPRSRGPLSAAFERDPVRAPRRSCATWPPPAATCCSAPAATTSTTPPRPATSASPGRGCRAIDGFNRIHAILGTSEHCIATHPSDMCVAPGGPRGRRACRAGRAGERTIPIRRVPSPARRHAGASTTTCSTGEIITAIELPAAGLRRQLRLPEGARPPVLRLRAGLGRGRAATWTAEPDHRGAPRARRRRPQAVARSRKRRRCSAASRPTPELFARRGRRGPAMAPRAYEHNAFKIELARRAIVRALTQAADGTPQSQSRQADPVRTMPMHHTKGLMSAPLRTASTAARR